MYRWFQIRSYSEQNPDFGRPRRFSGAGFFLAKLPSHLDRLLIIVHIQWRNPPKVSENINFGNCSGITDPGWTLLSDDSESIAISFLADDCGFIVETEPNIIYQSTLFIPNSGKFNFFGRGSLFGHQLAVYVDTVSLMTRSLC